MVEKNNYNIVSYQITSYLVCAIFSNQSHAGLLFSFFAKIKMYILYCEASGSQNNKIQQQKYT
jgi:hypothetical protein